MRDLSNATVVVTGASSGVGRATAEAFARRGANVVLAARGAGPLERAADSCRRAGGRAVAVPTDVTDPEAVRRLAEDARDAFRGIDVWVNNAGVGAVGRFADVPLEAHRRVVETNLMGCMHGAHAVLPHFLDRGRGVLINMVSVGGFVPTPFAAAYAASKFGLRAFSDSLREELRDHPGIHVCAVYPYFMDTPGVHHGANYTGRALRPAPPVLRPETTAEVVVGLARRPRATTTVGMMTRLARIEHAMAPRLVDWGLGRTLDLYLRAAAPAPATDGNLVHSLPARMEVRGGWRRSGLRAGAVVAAGVAAGVVATAALRAGR